LRERERERGRVVSEREIWSVSLLEIV